MFQLDGQVRGLNLFPNNCSGKIVTSSDVFFFSFGFHAAFSMLIMKKTLLFHFFLKK